MACVCGGQHLTSREIDVLVRCAVGMNAAAIGARLHISRRTVEYHVATILRRTDAANMVEAVARCYALGVLVPDEWPPRWSGRRCLRPRDQEGTAP
jgi:DNA-binding CsgD family transcriptional regulator